LLSVFEKNSFGGMEWIENKSKTGTKNKGILGRFGFVNGWRRTSNSKREIQGSFPFGFALGQDDGAKRVTTLAVGVREGKQPTLYGETVKDGPPRFEPDQTERVERLELDATGELRGSACIVGVAGYVTEAGVADRRAGNGKPCVVGDVVHFAAEAQLRRLRKVQRDAAHEGDIQLVVARTVEVVRSGTRSVGDGVERRER
jgi:hypothetical protein